MGEPLLGDGFLPKDKKTIVELITQVFRAITTLLRPVSFAS